MVTKYIENEMKNKIWYLNHLIDTVHKSYIPTLYLKCCILLLKIFQEKKRVKNRKMKIIIIIKNVYVKLVNNFYPLFQTYLIYFKSFIYI